MKKLALAACFLGASVAQAALPPLYQSKRELSALLENGEVQQLITSGRAIVQIKASEKNGKSYKITTQDGCTLKVKVEYKPVDRPGPAQFDLKVGKKLKCKTPT
ncbi:MAG: hypothetical protein HYW48_03980 [Deltaproteobacteria bacterium]|nr:hypothetical protein [Deltaproteobacteria bacterium]